MTDYKDTLNLPQTDFPMKANLAQREPERLKHWLDSDIYQKIRAARAGGEKFILHDGPPYANGDIHLGHAVNKTLKDIIVKAKTLSGYDVPFIPGWDCHGLPIELNVEKKIGKPGAKVSVAEFRTACRQYAQKQVDKQRESFKRLGVFADWDHPYLTMDFKYEADIIRSFAKIIENGHLRRGFRPVHWCVACGSALAEAEVEYQDKPSSAIDVRFDVKDVSDLLKRFATSPALEKDAFVSVPIWTTTPWTLPANQAVSVHPEFTYVIAQGQAESTRHVENFLIAEDLLENVMTRYGVHDYQVIGQIKGKALEGLQLQHPFYDRIVPVILGAHVTTETGTGAVHTAPGHGLEDYVVGQIYNLPVDNPVDAKGRFLPDTQLFAGENVYDANAHIIDVLKERGALIYTETITHSYPHCWRHKKPLIFRATPQWFVDMNQEHLRESVLSHITEMKWIPPWGATRIADMVVNRPDWCISRQRVWGVPVALFIHKDTGELHQDNARLMEEVAKRVEKKGVDVWDKIDSTELLGDEADQYVKSSDTLDVWLDSGVSHACVVLQRDELRFPADLYLEGSDQYRGWFQSSLITSCAIHNQVPCHQVLTHGFTLDVSGRKMSKSVGNVIVPEKVMKTLGADVLRLWVASTDYRGDIAVSDEIIKRATDTYRRIRNTARFLLSNLNGFNLNEHLLKPEKMLALDRWAVDKARLIQEDVCKAYDEYQFNLICQKIHHFCSIDMGSFYLDIIKDRQYTTQKGSIARRSAQSAMYHIIEALVRWIAPILSFTAEEIWQSMPGEREESVFIAAWYENMPALPKTYSMNQAYWENVAAVRNEVNKEIERLRRENILGSPLEAEVVLYVNEKHKKILTSLEDELRFVLITSSAVIEDLANAVTDAVDTGIEGLKLQITASTSPKCARCWHRRADVGENPDHPEICDRCVENITGQGEVRQYA